MKAPNISAILANANMKLVMRPDLDMPTRNLASLAMDRLINQAPSAFADPAVEQMRAIAIAADRLSVLIESDSEGHNGASPEDTAAYEELQRLLARWQVSYADRKEESRGEAADSAVTALNDAILRIESGNKDGSDIIKEVLPQMKAAAATYSRMRTDHDVAMLRGMPSSERFDDSFLIEMFKEVKEVLGDLFKRPGHVMTSDNDRKKGLRILSGIEQFLAGRTQKEAEPARYGPSNAKASAGLQLMKDAIGGMDGVWLGEVKSDFGGGWIGDINMADGTRVLANFTAHGHIDLGVKPMSGPFEVAVIRQVDLSLRPTPMDIRTNLQSVADVLAAATVPKGALEGGITITEAPTPPDGPVGKLLAHAAITHDTLSELAENGELPSAIQDRVANHLEEGTALFRAAGIESKPAPITADSPRI